MCVCFLHLQSGFDTIYSANFFSIPVSDVANLSYTSNVNVMGRWVFRVDKSSENDGIKNVSFSLISDV